MEKLYIMTYVCRLNAECEGGRDSSQSSQSVNRLARKSMLMYVSIHRDNVCICERGESETDYKDVNRTQLILGLYRL